MTDYQTSQWISDDGPTVAQRILYAMKTKLEVLEDARALVFRSVYFGDLEDLDNTSLPVAGIDHGTEEKISEYGGCSTYNMPMFFHFRFRGARGLDELDKYRYYLGILQKAVLSDHTLGGLTNNIEEETNSHSIVGIEDVYPGGTMTTLVTYRTRLHNPYKLITEAP
jgi:hypothetical protein